MSALSAVSVVLYLLFALLPLVLFGLNVWFLVYIERLRRSGCKCADGWRRQFMEFMLAVFVILFIVGLAFPVNKYMVGILSLIYLGLFVVYVVVTRQFITAMHETNCTCAETNALAWLNWINIFQIIVLIVTIVLAIVRQLDSHRSSGGKASSSRRR